MTKDRTPRTTKPLFKRSLLVLFALSMWAAPGAFAATFLPTDHCVDGAICAQDEAVEGDPSDPQWDSFTCRAICATQEDCGTGLECRGVTAGPAGVRACQPFRTP